MRRQNWDVWLWPELLVAATFREEAGWNGRRVSDRDPLALELSRILRHARPILVHKSATFRSPGSAKAKLENLMAEYRAQTSGDADATSSMRESVGDKGIVEFYRAWPNEVIALGYELRGSAGLLIDALEQAQSEVGLLGEERTRRADLATALEGSLSFRINAFRVRNRSLRESKIREVRAVKGALTCEACGFDFEVAYGSRGRNYIEVHHLDPVSETGETLTGTDRLAVLCANCHRMVHVKRPWLTVEDLGQLVEDQRRT